MRLKIGVMLALLLIITAPIASAQTDPRDVVRERVGQVLATAGQRPDVNVTFRQSTKNPYNFVGTMSDVSNVDSLEIVVSVTQSQTIGFRIYPRYRGAYINVNRVKDAMGLMSKLLYFSDQNFLFWGTDSDNDIFSGFTVTLESGVPDAAIITVVRSIKNTGGFVGQLQPFID
jgi:hypothetical protein